MRKRNVAILTAAAVILIAGPIPAHAADTIQQQIDAHLTAYPGGKQTSPTEITYGHGKFVITFVPADRSITGPDCPSNRFCFYDRIDYGFPRGVLADCSWQDLAPYGWQNRTESAYYNMSYGSVAFIIHGSRPDHGYDYAAFYIGTAQRGIRDVHPYRNQADHVYRFC